MNYLFVAPFYSHLKLDTSKIKHRECEFEKVKNNFIKKNYGSFPWIKGVDNSKNEMKFQNIQEDANKDNNIVFRIDTEHLIESTLTKFRHNNPSIEFKAINSELIIFHYGISNLVLELSIDDHDLESERVQDFSNKLMTFVVQELFKLHLKELFVKFVKELNNDFIHIRNHEKMLNLHPLIDHVVPLWVNRTLLIDDGTDIYGLKTHILNWLALGGGEWTEVYETLQEDGKFLNWGHNIIIQKKENDQKKYIIEAIHLCQYYYSVLEMFNNELTELIGKTFTDRRDHGSIKKLRKKLNKLIFNVNFFMITMDEEWFNVQGQKKVYLNDLIKKWRIDRLKEMINKKVAYCQEKADDINNTLVKRNQTISEIILFAIGGIALVDFFTSVSQFSFAIRSNSNHIDYEYFNLPGILDLALKVAPDGMIFSGFIILLFLFSLYFTFINRSRS
ncbi:hypothetical protein LCM10_02510 [Rossellomorea aquimaris]|uniref:hypothetical protein n=1 Tax=Rossellomorea aquimaris TaxID=189382 RepID=UPI001CD3DD54|nr:hypothetical protein [Rossellomorea aquimaris]MCA1053845.1 hypothetical protein [Rossellomorea aquimaris]